MIGNRFFELASGTSNIACIMLLGLLQLLCLARGVETN